MRLRFLDAETAVHMIAPESTYPLDWLDWAPRQQCGISAAPTSNLSYLSSPCALSSSWSELAGQVLTMSVAINWSCSNASKPSPAATNCTPPPASDNDLCVRCASLDFAVNVQSKKRSRRPLVLRGPKASSCPLCRFLATVFRSKYPSVNPDDEFSTLMYLKTQPIHEVLHVVCLSLACAVRSRKGDI